MPLSTAGAIGISAAIQAASGLGSAFANSNLNRKNRKWQTSEREASQKYEDWQIRQNLEYLKGYRDWEQEKYTSPAAQIRLLKEAGLNPDLAYGSIGGSPVDSIPTGVSAPSAPSVSSHGFDSAFNQISSIGDHVARAGLIDSERHLNESTSDLNRKKSEESDSVIRLNDAKIDLTDAQADWTKEDRNRIITQVENLQTLTNKTKQEINNLIADERLKRLSADEKAQVISEMKKTFDTRFNTLRWQERRSFVELGITEKEFEKIQRTFEYAIDKFIDESLSTKYKSKSDFFALLDQEYMHQFSIQKDGSSKSPANILMDLTVAMAQDNAATIEKNLDILNKYKDAHEIINVASQLYSLLSQVMGIDFIKSISPKISAF